MALRVTVLRSCLCEGWFGGGVFDLDGVVCFIVGEMRCGCLFGFC